MATLEEYDINNMNSIDLIEDVENKIEDLIQEKIEIIAYLFGLRFNSSLVDNDSYLKIESFMNDMIKEATYEQLVLNKLYDYLMKNLDKYGYEYLENSKMFLEYVYLLSYFDDIEDNRVEEYVAYIERINQLLLYNSISPSFLEDHRKFERLDQDKAKLLYNRLPQ